MSLPILLLTRPEVAAKEFVISLDPEALSRVEVLIAPLMRIEPISTKANLDPVAAAIFTSANGVAFAPDGEGRSAFCVGARTTQRAIARGWNARMSGSSAQELIAALLDNPPTVPLTHLGGEHTIGDIAKVLSGNGIATTHVALYGQKLLPLSKEGKDALTGPTILPVFSPRTARQLASEAEGALESASIIALSDSVAAPFEAEKISRCVILPSPQGIYMRKAVEKLCLEASLP